jgi:hypothetical protein
MRRIAFVFGALVLAGEWLPRRGASLHADADALFAQARVAAYDDTQPKLFGMGRLSLRRRVPPLRDHRRLLTSV